MTQVSTLQNTLVLFFYFYPKWGNVNNIER